MNYGAGTKERYVDGRDSLGDAYRKLAKTKIDLFGLRTDPQGLPRKFKSNKNYCDGSHPREVFLSHRSLSRIWHLAIYRDTQYY